MICLPYTSFLGDIFYSIALKYYYVPAEMTVSIRFLKYFPQCLRAEHKYIDIPSQFNY